MRESRLEAKCVAEAKKLGFQTIKMAVGQGWPDRLFFKDGRMFFVEFKRLGEKLRRLQQHRATILDSHNIERYTIDNFGTFREILDASIHPEDG